MLQFYWFDYVKTAADTPYDMRMEALDSFPLESSMVIKLLPQVINSTEELDAFEADCLRDGFEGVMLRSPSGRYKFGRSTLKENLLLKLKRFEDAEAQIIGFEGLSHNANETSSEHQNGALTRPTRSQGIPWVPLRSWCDVSHWNRHDGRDPLGILGST
jgi:DNA ligase-1